MRRHLSWIKKTLFLSVLSILFIGLIGCNTIKVEGRLQQRLGIYQYTALSPKQPITENDIQFDPERLYIGSDVADLKTAQELAASIKPYVRGCWQNRFCVIDNTNTSTNTNANTNANNMDDATHAGSASIRIPAQIHIESCTVDAGIGKKGITYRASCIASWHVQETSATQISISKTVGEAVMTTSGRGVGPQEAKEINARIQRGESNPLFDQQNIKQVLYTALDEALWRLVWGDALEQKIIQDEKMQEQRNTQKMAQGKAKIPSWQQTQPSAQERYAYGDEKRKMTRTFLLRALQKIDEKQKKFLQKIEKEKLVESAQKTAQAQKQAQKRRVVVGEESNDDTDANTQEQNTQEQEIDLSVEVLVLQAALLDISRVGGSDEAKLLFAKRIEICQPAQQWHDDTCAAWLTALRDMGDVASAKDALLWWQQQKEQIESSASQHIPTKMPHTDEAAAALEQVLPALSLLPLAP